MIVYICMCIHIFFFLEPLESQVTVLPLLWVRGKALPRLTHTCAICVCVWNMYTWAGVYTYVQVCKDGRGCGLPYSLETGPHWTWSRLTLCFIFIIIIKSWVINLGRWHRGKVIAIQEWTPKFKNAVPAWKLYTVPCICSSSSNRR